MDVKKQYSIAYKGFKNGKHEFDFHIDNRFFAAMEQDEIEGGDIEVKIVMDRSASMLVLDITLKGFVEVECDRCLETLQLPVDHNDRLTVKFSQTEEESDGEVMWISPAENDLQLAQFLYESIVLSLPCQRVHSSVEQCNKDMIDRFNIVSQEEFDHIVADTHSLCENIDNQQLKQLLDKGSEK